MAVLLGLSGSKVMISMWMRPDRNNKKESSIKKDCGTETSLKLSHQVLIISDVLLEIQGDNIFSVMVEALHVHC